MELPLIETKRDIPQKTRHLFIGNVRAVERLDIAAHFGIAPDRSGKLHGSGLAGVGIAAPEMHEKRQDFQLSDQNGRKTCSQFHSDDQAFVPVFSCAGEPRFIAAMLPDCVHNTPVARISVINHILRVGKKAPVRQEAEAGDTALLRDFVIVQAFDTAQVIRQNLGILACDCNTVSAE